MQVLTTRNSGLIEEINAFRKDVVEKQTSNQETRTFTLGDLVIEVLDEKRKKITLGDHILRGSALKEIADRLRVKPSFFDLDKKMSKEDYQSVTNKIKEIDRATPIFAVVEGDGKGGTFIQTLYFIAPEKKIIDLGQYFGYITEQLGKVEKNYNKSQFRFFDNTVSLELINTADTLEVLPGDPWKIGQSIEFNAHTFKMNPFFLRKICTNGMTTRNEGFQAKIYNKKFNGDKISQMIEQNLLNDMDGLKEMVLLKVNATHQTNVSIAEFMEIRNYLMNNLPEEMALHFLAKHFPDNHLYGAYKCDYHSQSAQWQRTADSGINAYDHFNKMTWVASHTEKSKLPQDLAQDMKIKAASFLLKDTLDMTQIAPKVHFNL